MNCSDCARYFVEHEKAKPPGRFPPRYSMGHSVMHWYRIRDKYQCINGKAKWIATSGDPATAARICDMLNNLPADAVVSQSLHVAVITDLSRQRDVARVAREDAIERADKCRAERDKAQIANVAMNETIVQLRAKIALQWDQIVEEAHKIEALKTERDAAANTAVRRACGHNMAATDYAQLRFAIDIAARVLGIT